MASRAATPASRNLRRARGEIHDYLCSLGKSGDIDLILSGERALLQNDLDRHSNSKAMKGSLETALAELTASERLVAKVRDGEACRMVDEGFSLPKNRVGGVPRDEARQFFGSHAARLLNQDKSRLEEDEKKIVDARKDNMRVAERVYTALQRQALGLSETRSKKPGSRDGYLREVPEPCRRTAAQLKLT